MQNVYEELVKSIAYAGNNYSFNLMNQFLGEVNMARRLGAITKEQYLYLSGQLICHKYINNGEWRRKAEKR